VLLLVQGGGADGKTAGLFKALGYDGMYAVRIHAAHVLVLPFVDELVPDDDVDGSVHAALLTADEYTQGAAGSFSLVLPRTSKHSKFLRCAWWKRSGMSSRPS
jgi:hypothetical protein